MTYNVNIKKLKTKDMKYYDYYYEKMKDAKWQDGEYSGGWKARDGSAIEKCSSCNGTGNHKDYDEDIRCSKCDGYGEVSNVFGTYECSKCCGSGFVTTHHKDCPWCKGAGYTGSSGPTRKF